MLGRKAFFVLESTACLCCMNLHDRLRIVLVEAHQFWRAFAYIVQVHENHCVKQAGVAGLRARGFGVNRGFGASMLGGHGHFLGLVVRACVVVMRCV
ncbi:hypothetical protein [Enterobacter hormaechei]|uniref:hypothetical protein n=1 Tax=Enterobacter hormaechei TaxID=158836 RepID=UPI00190D249F|nr:hypothetical protein [Enterobacter hormaechei]MBK3054755.1 hypothetical protein [Enterobacter hormaechei]MDA4752264.1 hypothetical protein [Enterobacter hormaechei]